MEADHQTVLIVDDDAAVGEALAAQLEQWEPGSEVLDRNRFEAVNVDSGEKALGYLQDGFADVVVADLRMPGMDGLELLQRIQCDHPGTPVVMLTAHSSIALAVESMRAGAADFVEKPWNFEELVASLKRAVNAAPAELRDNRPHPPESRAALERLPTMERALQALRLAAPGKATVLIRGESGTGKNVAARMLHDLSPRARAPFITVQCTGIPGELLESELFGHEPGSFTGAGPKRKDGRVAWAEGGTLFLDEIGDVPLHLQVKLLQLLDKPHVYTRLGGDKELTAEVRVVAATHQPLEKMVKDGKFREDLFWRLNVIPVWIPPLRDRQAEVEQLATQFLERFAGENRRTELRFSAEALEVLRGFHWPGNIRQLENVVEQLVVLAGGSTISPADVRGALSSLGRGEAEELQSEGEYALAPQVRKAERTAILRALQKARGNRALAARLLGVVRRTLYNKLEEHGLKEWKPPSGDGTR
jgi:two-component system, NtrC family, response regulator AtoC